MDSKMRMVPYIGLGLVAAILAAVLVGLLQPNTRDASITVDSSGEAAIFAAAKDLPAGRRLVEGDLMETRVAASDVPAGASSSRAILLGRTTLLPLTKGQAIGADALVPVGTGPEIASRLKDGWRAITVGFADHSSGVVLYPGAVVDVLATLDLRSPGARVDSYVTTTVLEGVQVIAVGDKVAGAATVAETSTRQSGTLFLTLLVSAEDAKILELASERGSLAVALRSPGDQYAAPTPDATIDSLLRIRQGQTTTPSSAAPTAVATDTTETTPVARAPERSRQPWAKTWKIRVIRGSTTDTLEVKDSTSNAH